MPALFYRPCWAEISRGAFAGNFKKLASSLPNNTGILAVVKANAYGHGAVPVARWAEESGARFLGVASLEEGIELRQARVRADILVLGSLYPFEETARGALRFRLVPTVASVSAAKALSLAAKRLAKVLPVHVKLDTGLGRIGLQPEAALDLLEKIRRDKNLKLDGVYTHLASAGSDSAYTRDQLERFDRVLEAARSQGIAIPWSHAANSRATVDGIGRYNLVRPGLALYGLMDSFAPVLTWKTRVIFWKRVPEGASIGYGRTFRTARPSHIATLAVGYADGLSRKLSNRGQVLIQGRRVPIVGAISMDMAMADVTDIPHVSVGEEAVLIGRQGREEITVREMAQALETIPYEIVCGIGSRVRRVCVD